MASSQLSNPVAVTLLPNTDSEGARQAAESIKKRIDELQIPHIASILNDHVTASIGVALMIPTPGLERNEMVEHADKALYQAKLAGRNRIYEVPIFSV
ncbi:diguanylate cyclase [Paenibacillus nanensis]|uniref:Diguanylate cyclase n=1 Tax=Paenibacillus nanensis TaxID=393251 RepID=A0A3A1UPK2_9BACL|nr:diguanylate cyclase [Paenibacillus nanensis]RIX49267.1 diguanylate cyclase [Paenibacillus nanensis]